MKPIIEKKFSAWKLIAGGNEKIRAEYGFESMNGPGREHFSITGETKTTNGRGGWLEGSFGRIHDEEVSRYFPELRPLIRWHLTSPTGPMHYEENAIFWFERIGQEEKAEQNFRSTIVMGAVPGDEEGLAEARKEAFGADTADLEKDIATAKAVRETVQAEIKKMERTVRDLKDAERAITDTIEAGVRAIAERRSNPIRVWLAARKPALMAEFWKTMQEFGLASE